MSSIEKRTSMGMEAQAWKDAPADFYVFYLLSLPLFQHS